MTDQAPDPSRRATPSVDRRVLVAAGGLVVAALVPVAIAGIIGGAVLAQAVYVGMVLMTSVVRVLPVPSQLVAAGLCTAVSMLGAALGSGPVVGLALTLLLVCGAQAWFTRQSAQSVAVLPAILVFYALFAPPGTTVLIGVGTAAGALLLIGLARLARLQIVPNPVPAREAGLHAVVLAVGCCGLLAVGLWLGLPRTNWALLAFCLVFVPVGRSWRTPARYAAAAVLGALVAVAVGLVGVWWLSVAALITTAVLTVAFTLVDRGPVSVAVLTATVVLLGSILSAETAPALALQRAGLALLGALVAVGMMGLAHLLDLALARRTSGRVDRLPRSGGDLPS